MADCTGWFSWLKPSCATQKAADVVAGTIIETLASSVMTAMGRAVASLGTMWVNVGTPNLTASGGSSSAIKAGNAAAGSENLVKILGYVSWVSISMAIISLFILGALIAVKMRSGEGVLAVGRLGLILSGVIIISAAGALVANVLPKKPTGAGGAVLFLQSALWWYMGAAAVLAVIVGGAKMAWEQRAEPGREALRAVLTLLVVAGAGVTVISLAVAAADSFSTWILEASLKCNLAEDQACFGRNITGLMVAQGVASNPVNPVAGIGAILTIILGVIVILASIIQILLMVARGGMLVILAGVFPLAASFTNTEMGKSWFKKAIGWLIAFILYKPVAAIVYATAFQLAGANIFKDDGSGLITALTGLLMMLLAVFALPALLRFVTPMAGATAGGSGGFAAGAALGALPTGAAALGRILGRGSENTPPPNNSDPQGSTTPPPSESSPTTGAEAGGASGGASGGVEASSATSGATAGTGASGAAAGAGPIGAGIAVGMEVGGKTIGAVSDGAKSLGEDSTGQ